MTKDINGGDHTWYIWTPEVLDVELYLRLGVVQEGFCRSGIFGPGNSVMTFLKPPLNLVQTFH